MFLSTQTQFRCQSRVMSDLVYAYIHFCAVNIRSLHIHLWSWMQWPDWRYTGSSSNWCLIAISLRFANTVTWSTSKLFWWSRDWGPCAYSVLVIAIHEGSRRIGRCAVLQFRSLVAWRWEFVTPLSHWWGIWRSKYIIYRQELTSSLSLLKQQIHCNNGDKQKITIQINYYYWTNS